MVVGIDPIVQLAYVSTARVAFGPSSLVDLLALARRKNQAIGVTGVLMYQEGAFLQFLEGGSGAVDATFARIGADGRHQHVVTLVRADVETRAFPDWSMGFLDTTGTAARLDGFRAGFAFADLIGDRAAVDRVVAGFRKGRWQRHVAA